MCTAVRVIREVVRREVKDAEAFLLLEVGVWRRDETQQAALQI
jgi:hypothetical protein